MPEPAGVVLPSPEVIPEFDLPDRYRVVSEIGRGGVSVVYLADDLQEQKRIAIKVLKLEIATAVSIGRFLREIALQSSLPHENILPILDSGDSKGVPYLVLPYVEGGSLRQKLRNDRQLPWQDALRITRDLASALDAAHASGIVHRDVKPENVLLDGDRSLLADFGIARAFSEAATERLTESGIVIGTAGYMSPEQAEGVRELDARSDIYSLACVTYEMLAGETPYTGPTRVAIAAKQLTLPIPSVHLVREGVSEAVDEVFRVALAKTPADRFQRAGEFVEALARAGGLRRRRLSRRQRTTAIGIAASALLALGLFSSVRAGLFSSLTGAVPDITTYAVFPISGSQNQDASRRVRDAFLSWSGIRVVDDASVRESLRRRSENSLNGRALASITRRLSAGRFVRGEIVTGRGGTELHVGLYDARGGGALLTEARGIIRGANDGSDAVTIQVLVDSLLLNGESDDEQLRPGVSRSLPARLQFLRGERAMANWELRLAETFFDSAAVMDTGYVRPRLALAMVRSWTGAEPAKWRIAAEQAAIGAKRLATRDRLIAEAILAQSRNDFGKACPLWERAIAADTLYAYSWYGSAHCKVTDNLVLTDARSPSGYRFRTSYHAALGEYQRSFELLPPILTAFRDRSFESLRLLFKTSASNLREGRASSPESQRFYANPWWVGDSLALVPFPLQRGMVHVSRNRPSMNDALRRQRELVRSITSSWVAAYPSSADAWQALSIALSQLGDRAALDTISRARAEARDPAARLRVAATDASLQLAFGVSDGDSVRLQRVRAIADSLISDSVATRSDPILVCALAALTGRARLAAKLAGSTPVAASLGVPPPIRDIGTSFLVYASLGGPVDTLQWLEQQVDSVIDRVISPTERLQRRQQILARGVWMAYPAYRSARLAALASEDPMVELEAAFVGGKHDVVRRNLNDLRESRRDILPESLTLDALVPEADLFWQLSDVRATRDWLSPTLAALPREAQRLLASPIRAAMLVRALVLKARAEAAVGNTDAARRYAAAVAILWSDADPFLQPIVAELQSLVPR